jgi:hypothetical protein
MYQENSENQEILSLKKRIKKLEQIIVDNNLKIKDRCNECNKIISYNCQLCDIYICSNCNYLCDSDKEKCMEYNYKYICFKCKNHMTHQIKPYTCFNCREIKCIECDGYTENFKDKFICNTCVIL